MSLSILKVAGEENVQAIGGLFACPDCNHRCSNYAEACPSCGRFFRSYFRTINVTPGSGWSMVVFWGIMLAWIIPTLLTIALIVIVIIMGVGAASLAPTLQSTPPSTSRQP